MAFGIIHFVYAVNAIIMTIIFVILLRKFADEKNRLTLLFALFILSILFMCYTFVPRGLFEANDPGSIFFYKISLICTTLIPTTLVTFMLYPSILQRGGFSEEKLLTIVLLLMWFITIIIQLFIFFGDVSLSYTELNFDSYQVTFGPVSFLAIIAVPIVFAIVDLLGFAIIAVREKESYYRQRALLLLLGWTMSFVGIAAGTIQALIILTPILFGAGIVIMAYAILRKAPS